LELLVKILLAVPDVIEENKGKRFVAVEVSLLIVEDPPAVLAIVWFGNAPVIVIFAPATKLGVDVPVPP